MYIGDGGSGGHLVRSTASWGAENTQGSISNFFIGDYDQEEGLASFSPDDDASYERDSVDTQTGESSEHGEPAGDDYEDTDDDLPFAQYVPHQGERSITSTVVKVTHVPRPFVQEWKRPSPERKFPAVAVLAVGEVSESSEPIVNIDTAESADGPSCYSPMDDVAGPADALRSYSKIGTIATRWVHRGQAPLQCSIKKAQPSS